MAAAQGSDSTSPFLLRLSYFQSKKQTPSGRGHSLGAGSLPRAAEQSPLSYFQDPSDLLASLSELPALSIFGFIC